MQLRGVAMLLLALALSAVAPVLSDHRATAAVILVGAAGGVLELTLPPPDTGPESLAFDRRGGGPYTGVSDGRVLKWLPDQPGGSGGGHWEVFAFNIKHCTDAECAFFNVSRTEGPCGRPLGLQFHNASGDLYIADAYMGLMVATHEGGLTRVLANEADGVPFVFTNGIDVDQATSVVYFTDSSTVYQRRDFMKILLTGDATGRLLSFDPVTKEVKVLQSGLGFPNGVALSHDRTHVVVAHTTARGIWRYWVAGARKGVYEHFANVPGNPDNIRRDDRGGYWVGMRPAMGVGVAAAAARLDGEGRVVEIVREWVGAIVSEVDEVNGSLWFGSIELPYLTVYTPYV